MTKVITEDFASLFLILLRTSIVLFMFPVFQSNNWPAPVKAGLSLVLAVFFFKTLRTSPGVLPDSGFGVGIMVVSELLVGLVLALTVRFFLAAIQLAGQLVGFQMGFGIVNVFDPVSGDQASVLGQFGYWTAVVLFLLLDGHHVFVRALAESFTRIPVGGMHLTPPLAEKLIRTAGDMFTIAVKLGAPAVAALLLTSAAFGIVARTVPQINILVVAFPLQILVGLVFFSLTLQVLLVFTRRYLVVWEGMLRTMSRLMGG